MTTALYDRIGRGYSDHRRPDPRIAALIRGALENCDSVVNVGAGTGSYEPQDRRVVAVELSETMIRQRPVNSAPVVRASAMALPFHDHSFSAAMAILTIHHWSDRDRGIRELKRMAKERVLILTWEPPQSPLWLMSDYLPHFLEYDRKTFPHGFATIRTRAPSRPFPFRMIALMDFFAPIGGSRKPISIPAFATQYRHSHASVRSRVVWTGCVAS